MTNSNKIYNLPFRLVFVFYVYSYFYINIFRYERKSVYVRVCMVSLSFFFLRVIPRNHHHGDGACLKVLYDISVIMHHNILFKSSDIHN